MCKTTHWGRRGEGASDGRTVGFSRKGEAVKPLGEDVVAILCLSLSLSHFGFETGFLHVALAVLEVTL